MINIMLVAGRSTESLRKYFSQRGTLEVTHSYDNLFSYKNELERNYIKVNKLVYVYQDNNMNIVRDMSLLRKLINMYKSGEGSFTVEEIVFFYVDNGDSEGINMFKSIMRDTGYSSFKVHSSTDALSFEEIYNHLFGLTRGSNVKTKKEKVYRKTRDSKIKRVYEPENGSEDDILEPWTTDNLDEYEKAKKFANQSETGRNYYDTENSKEINEKFNSPVLATYNIEDILKKKNIFIVSGESKSGVSVNTAMLVTSVLLSDRTVTLINLTEENDTREYVKNLNFGFSSYSLKMFMSVDKLEHNNQLNIININYSISDIRLEALKHIIENSNKINSDVIFIECPKDILEKSTGCVGFNLNRIFYSVETLEKEINKVYNFINTLSSRIKIVILLSENINTLTFPSRPKLILARRLSTTEIKNLFSKEITIIAPIIYDGVDDSIFETLMEV